MKLDLKFKENSQRIDLKFGQFQDISDGGYERGFSDGEKVGYSNGYAEGEAKGKKQGYTDGYNEGMIPSYYNTAWGYAYRNIAFPENTDLVLRVKRMATSAYGMFMAAKNLRSITLISDDTSNSVDATSMLRDVPTLETVDLTQFNRKFTSVNWFALGASKLKSIYGALDFSLCTGATIWLNSANALEDIEFIPNTIRLSIEFYWCTKLSKVSLTSIINGLAADTSGLTVTLSKIAVNTAFGSTTSSEWLDLIGTKSNWTVSLV